MQLSNLMDNVIGFFSASAIRLEIFLYYCTINFLTAKTLLLLLDHRTFSEDPDKLQRLRLDRLDQELDRRYIMTLLAKRCTVRII